MAYVIGHPHPRKGISQRYTRKGIETADDYWDEPFRPHLEVRGPSHVDTGLVTEQGDPIYRTQPPVGFGRDDEW
jgi:hypothetical protein